MARERRKDGMSVMDGNEKFQPATCKATICVRNSKGKCSLDDIAWGDASIIPDEGGRCRDFMLKN